MEVLDSVAHSVRVKAENLRLAEVRVLKLGSKLWATLVGAPAPTPLQGVWPLTVACPYPTHPWDGLCGWQCRAQGAAGQIPAPEGCATAVGQGMSIIPWRGGELSTASLWCCWPHSSLWG